MRRDDLFGKNIALLLDFDGTLVELVDDPMNVSVPPELLEALDKILTKTRTPVAIVTGRQIKVLDEFLELPNLAVSGNHGTEIRPPRSELITRHVSPMSGTLKFKLKSLCVEFDCIFEDKNETAVIHTSNEATFHVIRNELQKLFSKQFQDYILWPVNFSFEIHHRGFSKVTGIQDMLSTRAFKGRQPVYIGDDVETYPGFETLMQNVQMIPVGQSNQCRFSAPNDVRRFLTNFSDYRAEDDVSMAALFAQFASLYRGI